MIRIDLIEGLLAWFLLRRVLRRVVAVNQRVGNVCPRSPKSAGGKREFSRRGGHSSGRRRKRKRRRRKNNKKTWDVGMIRVK